MRRIKPKSQSKSKTKRLRPGPDETSRAAPKTQTPDAGKTTAPEAHTLEDTAPAPPTPELTRRWDAFWFERSIEASRLVLFRVLFFGLLGVDLLHLMVEKAYRYGAGGFNVAHFDVLDRWLPPPSDVVHTALYLLCGFLSLRIACGVAVRASLYVLAPAYAYAYFSSLHDAFQHHYLIAWLLLLCFALPLEHTGLAPLPSAAPKRRNAKSERSPATVRAFGVSLLYAQVSIVYLFTALAKSSEYWLNGWALRQQISTGWLRDTLLGFETTFGLEAGASYALTARAVFVWEFVAAAAFLFPKLRKFACISGPVFHATVELIGVDVRWFSYYMIAIYYVLLWPEAWFRRVNEVVSGVALRVGALGLRALRGPELSESGRRLLTGGAAITSGLLCLSLPLPGTVGLALTVGSLVLLAEHPLFSKPAPRSATALRLTVSIAAAALVAAVPRYSGAGYNYYRFKAGDLSRRGEDEAAVTAYRQAIQLNPGADSRHEKLGRLLLRLGRPSEALPVLEEAAKLRPQDGKVLLGLAEALEQLGRADEASRVRARQGQITNVPGDAKAEPNDEGS